MKYVVIPAPNMTLTALLAVPGLVALVFGVFQLLVRRNAPHGSFAEPMEATSRNRRIYQRLLGWTCVAVGMVHMGVAGLTRHLGPLEGARALGLVYFLMALLVMAVAFHHHENDFVSTRMGRVYLGLVGAAFAFGCVWYFLR